METISRTDRVRNEEVLHRVKEERIGHNLHRSCLLKGVIEGNV